MTGFSATTVSLAWTAPANAGTGGPILGYNVYQATTSGAEANPPVNGATLILGTTATVTGLNAGTTYYFTVQAVNAAGPSSNSNEASQETTTSAPGAPTAVTATAGESATNVPQVSLAWTAPAQTGGSAIMSYTITPYIGATAQAPVVTGTTATTYVWTTPTPGTTYTFTVAATNGVGTGSASAASNAVTPNIVPGAPTGIGGVSENGGISLSWTANPGSGSATIGYNVYVGTSATTISTTPINGSILITSSPVLIAPLTNGVAYWFEVQAVNSSGSSPNSAAAGPFTPVGPSPTVTGVTVAGTWLNGAPSPGVTVSWTNPTSTGGAPLVGFNVNIYYSTNGGTNYTQYSTGTPAPATSLTVPTGPWAVGNLVYATVAPSNGYSPLNTSANSNTITLAAGVPGAPTATLATVNPTSLVLNWTAPANTGNGTILGYNVYQGTTAGGEGGTPINGLVPLTSTTATITSLTSGTTYYFTVKAVNAIGQGNASNEVFGIPGGTAPGAPTGVAGTGGNGVANLSWTAPANPGGASISDYLVNWTNVTLSSSGQFDTGSTATTFTTPVVLVNGDTYTFTVQAVNAVGTGTASAASAAIVPVTTPTAPSNVQAAAAGANSVAVSWTAGANGGSPIVGYGVIPIIEPAGTALSPVEFANTSTTEVLNNLPTLAVPDYYVFLVVAATAVGTSPEGVPTGAAGNPGGAINPNGVPGAAAAPVASGPGNGVVTVTWTAPAVSSPPVTAYQITPYNGTTALPAQTFPAPTLSAPITGLTNGTAYTFTVTAINGLGIGAASPQSNAETPFGPPSAPPTNVVATPAYGQANLTWTAPASTNGSTITGYVVYYQNLTLSTSGFLVNTTPSTATSVTTPAVLAIGDTYTFTVEAITTGGLTPFSAPSNSVLILAVPKAPTGLGALAGNGTALLSWTAPVPNGVTVLGYNVFQGTAPGAESSTPVNGAVLVPGTTITVSGLTNGTTYYFTVAAVAAGGQGPLSNEASTGPAGLPGATAAPTATAGNAQVTIKWTAPTDDGGSTVLGYNVFVGTSTSGLVTTPVNAGLVTGTQFTVVGLNNGTQYFFTVAAVNAVGQGPASFPVGATPSTVAGAPSNITAVAGNNSATLTWSVPAFDGGSPITSYSVTPYVGGSAGTPQTFNSPAPVEIVTGLTNGTTYTFAVAAINANGTGANGFSNFVTPTAAAEPPAAPTGLTATAGNGSVALTWTAPAGSGITGYNVWQGTTSGGEVAIGVTQNTSFTATGLTNGTTYYFEVQAVNVSGASPASNEASATPAASATTTSLTLSKTVIHFSAQASVTFRATVKAQGPGPALGSWVRMKAGSKVVCDAQVAANGVASCVLPARSLKVGSYTITAWFTGNMSYTASTSPGVKLTITEP